MQDAISTAALQELLNKVKENSEAAKQAPWKGTEESVGDPRLSIIAQAIDAVDDNCTFPIIDFLKGAHYSLFLFTTNLTEALEEAIKEGDIESVASISIRLGAVASISDQLQDLVPSDDTDEA